jgi:hypothetical protein
MMLIKLSIGFFLLRLATQKVYVWILRISLVVVVLWSMVTFLWDIFQCNPVAKQWDYRIERGQCVTPQQVVQAAYAFSVMCVLSDWLFVSWCLRLLVSLRSLTGCHIGDPSDTHAVEGQDDQTSQGHRYRHPWTRHFCQCCDFD